MPLGSTIPIERKGRKQDWTEGQIEAEMLALVLTPLGATEIEKKKGLFQSIPHYIKTVVSLYTCFNQSLNVMSPSVREDRGHIPEGIGIRWREATKTSNRL